VRWEVAGYRVRAQAQTLGDGPVQTPLRAIPVTVVNCYRCLVSIEDRIDAEWQAHHKLEELTTIDPSVVTASMTVAS
jgi:hypothetical protein